MKSILEYLNEVLDNKKVIAIYPGGFKPPTKGHFEVVKKTLNQYPEIDKFIILVGSGVRDNISQEQSMKIWEYYNEVLGSKLEIRPSSSPIGDVLRLSKDNPDDLIYYISGVREGKEDDIQDLISRTKSISKYPNLKVKTITTSNLGISGTNARLALTKSKEEFFKYLLTEVPSNEQEEIYNLLKPKINENLMGAKPTLKDLIKELTQYMSNHLDITPLPKVKFINNDIENSGKILGKTAYYDPYDKVIVLYTNQRHPKDIARSFAHEMIHHEQNLKGKLNNINTSNTNESGDLPEIEREAYEKGNMLFRNWEDNVKTNPKKKYLHESLTENNTWVDLLLEGLI